LALGPDALASRGVSGVCDDALIVIGPNVTQYSWFRQRGEQRRWCCSPADAGSTDIFSINRVTTRQGLFL
jgi:hypothetical protein